MRKIIYPDRYAKSEDGDFYISDWLHNRNTVEFLGIWESVNNSILIMAKSPQLKVRQVWTVIKSM